MYKVIHFFTDLQDNDFAYEVGDTFPRKGKKVSKERLEELSGASNKQNRALIEEVKETTTGNKKAENKRNKSSKKEEE